MPAPVCQPAPPRPRRACEILPAQWWDTGDDGNRLAIMLCKQCEGCTMDDPNPCGVIRAGVPYADDAHPRALCPCGYPATARIPVAGKNSYARSSVQLCHRCQPPGIDRYRAAIIRWRDAGEQYGVIAARIAFSPDHVSKKYREWTKDREATPA